MWGWMTFFTGGLVLLETLACGHSKARAQRDPTRLWLRLAGAFCFLFSPLSLGLSLIGFALIASGDAHYYWQWRYRQLEYTRRQLLTERDDRAE